MMSPEILGCCLVLISFALFYHFVCWTDSSSPPQIFNWNVLMFLHEETAPSPLVSAISCLPGFSLGVPSGTSWCGTFLSLWAWLKEPCACQASLGRRSSFSSSRIFPLLRLLPWNLEDGENHKGKSSEFWSQVDWSSSPGFATYIPEFPRSLIFPFWTSSKNENHNTT